MAVYFVLFKLKSLSTLSGAQANAEQVVWFRMVEAYQKDGPIHLILAVVLVFFFFFY